MAKFSAASAALLAVMILNGCAVSDMGYERLEIPHAVFLRNLCHGSAGPATLAYYPYHGIHVSLDVTGAVELGLHIPAGMTVTIDGNRVIVSARTSKGSVTEIGTLRAVRHGSFGTGEPAKFAWQPDPYTSPTMLGPLQGAAVGSRYMWYLFAVFDQSQPRSLLRIPPGFVSGTVELPPLVINGQRYPAQVISFTEDKKTKLTPVNCRQVAARSDQAASNARDSSAQNRAST